MPTLNAARGKGERGRTRWDFRAPEKKPDRLAHLVYATRSHEVLDMQDEHMRKHLNDRDLLAQARRTDLHGLGP